MNIPANQDNILVIWIVSTTLILLFMIPVIIWASRSGQFKNMDRSRYLPLMQKRPR